MLGLLVMVQGGAKRGKLTLLGVLRGIQLELKGSRGELLECLGRVLGGSWEHFIFICGVFWSFWGAWRASLTRFAEISKNHEKHGKVLQKSRFGGPGIDENRAWRAS